jgi:hypothetical protein
MIGSMARAMSPVQCHPRSVALATAVICGLVMAASLPGAQGRSSEAPLPEIGVTYTQPAIPDSCDLSAARGLIKTYAWPGTRKRARLQLAAMRAAGIDSIRILMWHLSEPASNDTTNLPSAGGRLVEPYRTNLIHFVGDIRSAGIKSLVVEYSPQWTNNPFGEWGPNGPTIDRWDPSKFDENWEFIRDTHELIERYGPTEIWFDPASEFAPTDYVDQVLHHRIDQYLTEMYRRYITTFGKDDLVPFVIAKDRFADGMKQEFRHLISDFESAGFGLPTRFGAHPTQESPTDLQDLRDTDAAMRALGLEQPLMIGEALAEGPNSRALATDIAEFARTSGRAVPEIYLWFTRFESRPLHCASAPYRADSYISAFTGSPVPFTLSATVRGSRVDFRTPYSQPVTAVTAGQYRVRVIDGSRGANFHVVGPRVDLATGIRSTGARHWVVTFSPGLYRFGSDRAPRKFKGLTVLRPG